MPLPRQKLGYCVVLLAVAGSCAFPFSLEARWVAAGPFGGNAEAIAASTRDPHILIAGTKNANLFLSVDGGMRWEPLDFPRQYTSMLHAVQFEPGSTSVVYAAIAADAGSGLFRSEDCGRSWRAMSSLSGSEVYSLAIWPKDSKVLAAGLRDGVYLSKDRGTTWSLISPATNIELQPVVSVAFDPRSSGTIYAGTPRLPWKTTDGGANWSLIAEGMSTDSDIINVRVDPVKPSRVFIGACSGFWHSNNGGETWSKMAGIPFESRRTYAFVQDTHHPEVIFAGTSRGLYATRDGGGVWKNIAHNEIKSLAFSNETLYIATADDGLFKSEDHGETLQKIDDGFTSRNFSPLSENGNLLLTGTNAEADAGAIFSSADGGFHWNRITDPERLGYASVIAVARSSSGSLLAATRGGLFRSSDNGETWTKAGPAPVAKPARKLAERRSKASAARKAPHLPPAPAHTAAPQPEFASLRFTALCATGDSLLAGTETGLYRSKDDGQTWALTNFTGRPVQSIYCGPDSWMARLNDQLMISRDGGASWAPRHLPFFAETYDVAGAGNLLIAGTSRGLFRSEDAGMTWVAAKSGLPTASITTVAIDPLSGSLAWASEYGHIYESRDGGKTWQRFDQDGLGSATIRNFAITTQAGHNLLAVTSTRGIYVREIEKGETSRSSLSALDLRKDGYVPNQQND